MTKTNAEKHFDELRADSTEYKAQYLLLDIADVLASQVRTVREKRGMNQGELAKLLGTTQSQISRFENPMQARYSLATLARLATVLDCSLQINLIPNSSQVQIPCSSDYQPSAKTSTDYASAVIREFPKPKAA